jgi:hypothetical protein
VPPGEPIRNVPPEIPRIADGASPAAESYAVTDTSMKKNTTVAVFAEWHWTS